ncbi:hypothetical protein [Marivirga harenae]|uniref:hypothetical protein n=1 Tax=Marivirga harenae TaxID=2010992 RepID=UPI0026DFC9DF|nr:hypothetical protein [Marivirga harenae]WKV13539.1 hypothetical protein Q3Y49_06820 [Marivirga harenae]|tara:strand:- start:176976 stop:177215 length:240 start_codon:yes stop_codon:yes gene_type:complete
MTKIFTHDDLIRYVYSETEPDENRQIELALSEDMELLEQYHELLWLRKQMDGGLMNPSEKTINSILEYSKAVNLHPVKE